MKLRKALKKLDRATRKELKKLRQSGTTTERELKLVYSVLKGAPDGTRS